MAGFTRCLRATVALALIAALASCGGGRGASATDSGGTTGGSTGGSSGGGATAGVKYVVPVAPQPLSAQPVPDSARAVTQTVAAASGGSVQATGADGITYTLTIPANALAADLAVTMTPVARFDSLPFNGSDTKAAWGVELAQLEPNSSAIDLKLMHFSGWAIARHDLGLSASLSGLRDRLGGTEEAPAGVGFRRAHGPAAPRAARRRRRCGCAAAI